MSAGPLAGEGIVSVVIGTAGHIDHGKSSLVRRLTGVDPDRLKEEKERELTIDLGFAPYRLPSGETVGIIDVPGHERFVKNMVAGATGIDLVILVVAADDGVMPQTREHLEILTLLGIERGLVVITKTDLPGVDADLLELLELELTDLLAGTFLEGAEVLRVSSATGEGFGDLEARVVELVQQAKTRPPEGAFRLPVQRVFSARGFGTILTGVPLEGAVAKGDQVEVVLSSGKRVKGKVRGLQAYGRTVERVRAGHSSALNVSDVAYKEVHRGDVVCQPGIFSPAGMWEVRLTHLASMPRPLRQRETVRFHVGTAEVLGEVVLLEQPALQPGESGLCQVRLRHPVVAAAGDRFVVRRHSPMETIGGGVVLGASEHRLKPFKGFVIERLHQKEQVLDDADEALVLALDEAGDPCRADALVKRLKRPKAEVAESLARLVERGDVVDASAGKGQPAYVSARAFGAAQDTVRAALAAWHREHPFRSAVGRTELRARAGLPDGLFKSATAALVEDGRVVVHERTRGYAAAEHAVDLPEEAAAYAAGLERLYEEKAFQPPTEDQAHEALAPDLAPDAARDVFQHLLEEGRLVQVADDVIFHGHRYDEARTRVQDLIRRSGPLSASAFKDAIDSTRRYTIPLLEHFDEVGLTRREGNDRVLKGG